jgi:hypothetical protein
MRDNYRDIAQALARREAFSGHTIFGVRLPTDTYVVYSYGTLILRVAGGRVVYFDDRRYSKTTSRHQSLIRQAFPEATGGYTARVVYEY